MIARAALAAFVMLLPPLAHAGGCPAGSETTGRIIDGPAEHKGLEREVLTLVPTSPAEGREGTARLLQITVQPGGQIALHDHSGVPGFAYVLSGRAVEQRSDCAVPIERGPGDVVREHLGLTHFWKVVGDEPLVALVTHVIPDPEDL